MSQDLYAFVQERLKAIHPRSEWKTISADAGVPYSTLHKYAHGYTSRPSHAPLMAIVAALRKREGSA